MRGDTTNLLSAKQRDYNSPQPLRAEPRLLKNLNPPAGGAGRLDRPLRAHPDGQTTAPGSQRRALHFRERRRVPGLLRRLRALSGPGSAAGAARSAAERSLLGPAEQEEGSEAEEVPGRWAPCSTCGKCGSWWTRREYGGPGRGGIERGGARLWPLSGARAAPGRLPTWPRRRPR